MNIQSLSIVVPNKACINHCTSCPSRMHDNNYQMLFDENRPDFDLYLKDYMKRLEFARDNGCNTLMLTGTSEPQQNRRFLTLFGMMMQMMDTPFRSIEMQCTGALLDRDYLTFLRRHVGITTMALSVFSLDDEENMRIINPPKNVRINIREVAKMVKEAGMTLRMCLNLTSHFDYYSRNVEDIWGSPENLFAIMKQTYGADQVTLRVLYAGEGNTPEDIWVRDNAARKDTVTALREYVVSEGTLVGILPYGACKYDVAGMSVVIDSDSMGKEQAADNYKYLILRPDCRLYSSWDNTGSLVF